MPSRPRTKSWAHLLGYPILGSRPARVVCPSKYAKRVTNAAPMQLKMALKVLSRIGPIDPI
jgi:hypothetical protein